MTVDRSISQEEYKPQLLNIFSQRRKVEKTLTLSFSGKYYIARRHAENG